MGWRAHQLPVILYTSIPENHLVLAMALNLLFLCDEYPPGRHGGIGTAVCSLARALVRQGHRIVVTGLYDASYGGSNFFTDEGVQVHRYRRPHQSSQLTTYRGKWARALRRLVSSAAPLRSEVHPSLSHYQSHVRQLIRRHHIDLLVMPDFHDYIPRCARYTPPIRWPVPTVVVLHGCFTYLSLHEGKEVPDHWFRMERDLIQQATAIASVSEYAARQTSALFQLRESITVLHNGIPIPTTRCRPVKNDYQVIYTGALWETKGVFQLMKAWNQVHAAFPDARLLVLGKGPVEPVQAILSEDARASVRFLGHVDQETLQHHLSESAVAVFPSYAETFGLAPLEAMQANIATIFTARTSGPELIDDGEDGLLIDPDDVNGIAAKVLHLLRDRNDRDRLAHNGREKVRRKFAVDLIARRYLDFFESVLATQTSSWFPSLLGSWRFAMAGRGRRQACA